MKSFLRQSLFLFFLVTHLLGGGLPFSEVSPLSGAVDNESPVLLPAGMCEYWIEFMEKRSLGIIAGDEWYQLTHQQIVNRFKTSERLINGSLLCCPDGALSDVHPLVFWVVHGTWAQAEATYCDPENHFFKSVLEFARELAVRTKRPIEVVSYGWSGLDTHDARRLAGGDLRILAECFFNSANGYGPQWGFGHSHGVNVLLLASQETYFDSIVSLGAPVLESVYFPLHVGCIYHFYSLGDPWQKAGSVDVRSLKKFFTSLGSGERAYSRDNVRCTVYNFRVMLDALDPGHVTLKMVVPYLWQVFDTITEKYTYHSHFNLNVMNVFDGNDNSLQISIRDRLELIDALEVMTEQEITPEKITQLKNELTYSKEQATRFTWYYRGRNMSGSSIWWRKILANWLEFGELLSSKVPFLRFNHNARYSILRDRFLKQ